MQTMTALVRLAGDLNMTVKVHNVTPAEALLLMHVHDAQTKDVFEDAVLTEDVTRERLEERARLSGRYPEQLKLIEHLFPGRNAADIPDRFDELHDVPLEVASTARKAKTVKGKKDLKLTDDRAEAILMTGREPA
jgi:hypothetical protein